MTVKSRFKEKAVNAALIAFFMIASGVYSAFSQTSSLKSEEGDSVTVGKSSFVVVKNSQNHIINLAPNLNMSARAESLSAGINSAFRELKPTVSLHGSKLYFSRSNHPNNTNGIEDNEDIWYSDIDREHGGALNEPKRLNSNLNNAGPNFITSIAMSGDTIILGNQYIKKGKMRAGFSYSIRKDTVWSAPKAISIRNDYNLSEHGSAHVSLKSGVILLAVERAETVGKRDLYVSFWVGSEATEPVNLGKIINSDLEESSPYLAGDGKTLYFASKGHHGYGGFDVYRSTRLDETWTNWSTPENLGPVVNGALDEEFFTVTYCKKFAYFSKQVAGQNTDIYKIKMDELFGGKKAIFR